MFLCGKSQITDELMESALRFDPDSWRQLMQFSLKSTISLRFPKSCKEKAVLARSLARRMADVGDRLTKISKTSFLVKGSGGIDWLNIGAYSVKFAESGRAETLTHRPTSTTVPVPEWIFVDKTFALESNWCDVSADLMKPPVARILCADLFEKEQGPHVVPTISGSSKAFDAIVGEVVAQRTAEKNNHLAETGDGTTSKIKQKTRELNRKAGMQKARQELLKKKTDLKRKRSAQSSSSRGGMWAGACMELCASHGTRAPGRSSGGTGNRMGRRRASACAGPLAARSRHPR